MTPLVLVGGSPEERALVLRRQLTRHLIAFCEERISQAQYEALCIAIWDEAERQGITKALEDNWQDVS